MPRAPSPDRKPSGDLGFRLVDVPEGGDVRVIEHEIDLHLLGPQEMS